MTKENIKSLIEQMTLEEKAGLCSGADFWHLKGMERLGIPSVCVTDGPHGLRRQDEAGDHLGLQESLPAVCFPAGCATASSFDRNLLQKLGETIGEECQAMDVSVILGPALNIKRSPLCGRNFEYYSEDPLVSTELAAAYVKGVQSRNVGTSLKHFLANNQEHRRMTSSSEVDERTLREIYLASFEGAVTKAKPWTVMCSYNKLNGTYVSEHRTYLTDILRDEWKFDGYVVSDWGAVNDRVEGLKAGLDLEMPSSGGYNDQMIVEAVKDNRLEEKVVDQACERILEIIFRYHDNRSGDSILDLERDHEIARKVEEESIVLLKNEDHILPLEKERTVAVIGQFAETPRYQGGGSSHINSFRVESAMDVLADWPSVVYAQGYDIAADKLEETLLAEAVEKAADAECAIIFAGLPDSFESEGYDRKHMQLPEYQNRLIEAVADVQDNLVVVLHNGSPVEMPWISKVKGVVEAYLGGQAVGSAVVNVLYGEVNPSGRLAETFPVKLEDNPSYLFYGGEHDCSEYREGVFVGYRYYESKKQQVLFPFGHGLSYTEFNYSNLKLNQQSLTDQEYLQVSVDITNCGTRTGKEVVQLYVAPPKGEIIRPVRELRAFDKVEIAAGETKTVSFTLDKRAFAYWDTDIHDWNIETGCYQIQIGKSSQEILLENEVEVISTTIKKKVFHLNSTLGEIMNDPKGKAILETVGAQMFKGTGAEQMAESAEHSQGAVNDEMMAATMNAMPLRQLMNFVPGMKLEAIQQLIDALNA